MNNIKIGSHCSMSAPNYIYGSVKDALGYGANTLMIYSGAPQNTIRKNIEDLKIAEASKLLEENNMSMKDIIIHAPYIINLANTIKEDTYNLAVEFLKKEIDRTKKIGAKIIVLHPGSHVNAGEELGLDQIVKGLNIALADADDILIALETMAGKGSELGYNFKQIKYIIDHCLYSENLRVCMDTCHLHDAGYDMSNFECVLDEFDAIIGLDRLVCIHINDSKNINGAKKDRHANLGEGEIGFDNILNIIYSPRTLNVYKILETPFIEGKAPYKEEIEMIRSKKWYKIAK